jgi:thiamine biosynthesis lipoprotein
VTRPAATRRVVQVMGLPVTLALRGRHRDDPAADRVWQQVVLSLQEADRVFSTYRADSEVSRINRGELALDDASDLVHEVLALAVEARQVSGGAFDIWRPDADGVLRLDPSGVVKGWAVERAAAHLSQLEGTDSCLSAGGDLACRTVVPGAAPWRIGIEDPHHPQRLVAVVPVHEGAVATSGTAHRGAHIVDARTGRPPVGVASVTVVAGSLTAADIDATAAYALGTEAAAWLAARPGRTGLVVWADGSTTTVQAPDDVVPAILQIPHTV